MRSVAALMAPSAISEALRVATFGRLLDMLLAEGIQCADSRLRQVACNRILEGAALRRGRQPLFPGATRGLAALGDIAPGVDDCVRHFERRVRPADIGAGGGDLGIAKRRAMGLLGALEIWRSLCR